MTPPAPGPSYRGFYLFMVACLVLPFLALLFHMGGCAVVGK